MEMAIEGVLAIQSGSNPRLIQQKLQSMLPQEDAGQKEVA
jgi:chemotaxis protein MotA